MVLGTIRKLITPDFTPRKALDFGCGVGRVLIQLSSVCENVVRCDDSQSMLNEASRNCENRSITNVHFVTTPDFLEKAEQESGFDLVHSVLVFQHIPTRRGMPYLDALLSRLSPGGVVALHMNYHDCASLPRRTVNWAQESIPFVHEVANIVKRRDLTFPHMQMNAYDLDAVFRLMMLHGVRTVCSILNTCAAGRYYQAFLFGRKEM